MTNELIEEIKGCLSATAKRLMAKQAGNREWTHECLHELAELGRKEKYGVCPWPGNMKGEWLYDLIWYAETDEEVWPKRMSKVVMVLESEWSHHMEEVRYDFQKLIQAKAQIKVMIYENLDGAYEELKKDIGAFECKDGEETYLFANLKSNDFDFKVYSPASK